MPSALGPHQDAPSPADTGARLSAEERKLLSQLDACVDRMRKHTPDEPYILTIPQDEPKYHHFSRHSADLWLAGTPFTREDHPNVQYQTFFYHEPHSDLFHLHRRSQFEPVKAQNKLPVPDSHNMTTSNADTPNLGPKKKISLAAYKNKQAHAAVAAPAGTPTSEQAPRSTAKPEEKAKQQSDGRPENKRAHDPGAAATRGDTNREKMDRTSTQVSTLTTSTRTQHPPLPTPSPAPAHKMPRPSSPNGSKTSSRTKPSVEKAPKGVHLPARLSPLHLPARLSPTLPPLHLPARLSPTLPANIVASLDSRNHKRSTSDTSANSDKRSQASGDRPSSKQDSVLSSAKEIRSGDASPQGARRPTDVATRADRPALKTVPKAPATLPDAERRSVGTIAVEPKHASNFDSTTREEKVEDAPQSLIVTLKFSKQHRNNLRRLLQTKPSPLKNTSPALAKTSSEAGSELVKGVARKVSVGAKPTREQSPPESTATKRLRQDGDDTNQSQPKRKKIPEKLDLEKRASTPPGPAFPSPAVPSSTQKPQPITPLRKDIKTSTAMKRVESADGVANTTPLASVPTPSTRPDAGAAQQGQRANATTRPSPTSATLRTPESSAWWGEFQRLGPVAKSLKKTAMERLQQAKSTEEGSAESRVAAEMATLTYLESFCAFMLAFYCQDKSYATREPPSISDPPSWITLHVYWRFVLECCKPHPPLCGLISHLGIVYNATILGQLEGSKNQAKDAGSLHEASSMMLKAAREAEAKLPLHALMDDFPQTWQRFVSQSSANGEIESPGQYTGRIELPFGLQMSPLQAVRASHAIMMEWVAGRGLEYKPK